MCTITDPLSKDARKEETSEAEEEKEDEEVEEDDEVPELSTSSASGVPPVE